MSLRWSLALNRYESLSEAKNAPVGGCYDPGDLPPTSVPDAFERSRILPRANQVSTGHLIAPVCALVPPFRIPHPRQQKTAIRMDGGFRWQRMRDSNPRERSQSPVCYRYTNPLSANSLYPSLGKSQALFSVSQGKGVFFSKSFRI